MVAIVSDREVFDLVKDEYRRASSKFPRFNNAHEGYAVLLEEVDELWDNVKLNQKNPQRYPQMLKEAVQVAAMAVRFIIDCIPLDEIVKYAEAGKK